MKELKVYMVVQNKDVDVSYGVDSASYCAGVFLDKDDAIDLIKELTNNEASHVDKYGQACRLDGAEWIGTESSTTGYKTRDIRYWLFELTCGEQEKCEGEYPFLGGGTYYE